MRKEMSVFMRIEMGDHNPGRLNLADLLAGLGFDFIRNEAAQHSKRAKLANASTKLRIPGWLQKASHLARLKDGSAIYQNGVASHTESRPVLRQRNCFLEGVSVGHQCR